MEVTFDFHKPLAAVSSNRRRFPRGPKGVPKGSHGDPSKPQAVPRDPKAFCKKNKQIGDLQRILEKGAQDGPNHVDDNSALHTQNIEKLQADGRLVAPVGEGKSTSSLYTSTPRDSQDSSPEGSVAGCDGFASAAGPF